MFVAIVAGSFLLRGPSEPQANSGDASVPPPAKQVSLTFTKVAYEQLPGFGVDVRGIVIQGTAVNTGTDAMGGGFEMLRIQLNVFSKEGSYIGGEDLIVAPNKPPGWVMRTGDAEPFSIAVVPAPGNVTALSGAYVTASGQLDPHNGTLASAVPLVCKTVAWSRITVRCH